MILEEIRLPLVGLTAHEPVKVLEAHPARPLVKRSSEAVGVGGRIVVLAEPRRGVTVALEDRADGSAVLFNDGIITRVARRLLGDHSKTRRVVVAASDQGRAG